MGVEKIPIQKTKNTTVLERRESNEDMMHRILKSKRGKLTVRIEFKVYDPEYQNNSKTAKGNYLALRKETIIVNDLFSIHAVNELLDDVFNAVQPKKRG